MKKLTDQELDSVFKNAAEGYEPPFDQAAWEAMKVKLDQPRPTLWKAWMPFAFLGLMIFSAGVWVGTYLHAVAPGSPMLSESKDKLIQQEKMVTQKNTDQTHITTTTQKQVREGNHRMAYQKREADTNPDRLTVNQNASDRLEVTHAIKPAGKSNPIDESKFLLQKEAYQGAEALITDSLAHSPDEVAEEKSDTTRLDAEEEKNKKAVADSHSVYVRLLASPDFSSIDYASTTTTGSNYAFLVDYQITNRWSISTGAIWSMKKYSSDQETTYGKYTADRMVGDCRVLDIPINFYYRFLPQSRFSFYAGVGLSSYIMLEEDYTYTFDNPSGSRDFSFYVEGENNEWFKMLNISWGAQYQIAPRFQLQVEPFLKAPLTGIGEWDVELSSMGIFMGLTYKIN